MRQIHGGYATMDFAGLSHIPGTESTQGTDKTERKILPSLLLLQGSLKNANLSKYRFISLAWRQIFPLSFNLSGGCECLFQFGKSWFLLLLF